MNRSRRVDSSPRTGRFGSAVQDILILHGVDPTDGPLKAGTSLSAWRPEMKIQPLDLAALIRAVGLRVITVVGLMVFREPLANLLSFLSQHVNKLSFPFSSVELAILSELPVSKTVDNEVQQLAAAQESRSPFQSGGSTIFLTSSMSFSTREAATL